MTWKRILLVSLSWLVLTARPATADYVVSLPNEPSEDPAESNDYNFSIVSDLNWHKGDTATFNGGKSEIASVTPTNPNLVTVGDPYQLSNGNWSFDVKPKFDLKSPLTANTVIVVNYKNGRKRALIINPLGKYNFKAEGSTLIISFVNTDTEVTLGGWLPAPKPDNKDEKGGGGDYH